MKTLFLTTGGSPRRADYPLYVQEGLIEALSALVAGFGTNIFISGAAVTIDGDDHTITAGWAFYNNEIIRIPAHTWVSPNTGALGGLPTSIAYVEIIEVNNPLPYADGVIKPLTKETVLKFKNFTAEPSPVYFFDFKKLGTAIGDTLQPVFTNPIMASSGSGFAFASGVSSTGGTSLAIKKRIDKTLVLNGYVAGIAAAASTINGVANCKLILTLDAAYRPASNVYFYAQTSIGGIYNDEPIIAPFILFTDGKLVLRQSTTFFNPEVEFLTQPVVIN